MAYVAHNFPGLKNPVYLPDWLTVEIKIIPSSVPGWTSGQWVNPADFTSTTWHDTGNRVSNANGEYSWAATGGRAEINSAGSYNIIFDGTKVIVCQRFDELVGHAANHAGNVTSYGFEQAGWGPNYDFNKSWLVGTHIHAGVLHAIGKTAKAAMYQHNRWNGKDCPGEIRRRGIWTKTEDAVDANIAEIKAFVNGGDKPAPTPAPKPKPEPTKKRTFTLRFDTYIRDSPGFWNTEKNKSNVIKLMKAGTTGEIISGPVEADGVDFYDLNIEGFGTGWLQDEVLHTLEIKEA